MSSAWTFEEHTDHARELHALGLPDAVTRTVRLLKPVGSALVLGSTQPESDVDMRVARSLNIDIVKRRSGGGAVLVEPNDLVWFDVLIPQGDALWAEDVGRAFYWLGHVLAAALSDAGISDVDVYEGALKTTPWSSKVCFAGLGPGECTQAGKKILGISQRRTRSGALFQVSINRHFDGAKLAQLLSVPPEVMVESIAPTVGAVAQLEPEKFVELFLDRLHQL